MDSNDLLKIQIIITKLEGRVIGSTDRILKTLEFLVTKVETLEARIIQLEDNRPDLEN